MVKTKRPLDLHVVKKRITPFTENPMFEIETVYLERIANGKDNLKDFIIAMPTGLNWWDKEKWMAMLIHVIDPVDGHVPDTNFAPHLVAVGLTCRAAVRKLDKPGTSPYAENQIKKLEGKSRNPSGIVMTFDEAKASGLLDVLKTMGMDIGDEE